MSRVEIIVLDEGTDAEYRVAATFRYETPARTFALALRDLWRRAGDDFMADVLHHLADLDRDDAEKGRLLRRLELSVSVEAEQ